MKTESTEDLEWAKMSPEEKKKQLNDQELEQ